MMLVGKFETLGTASNRTIQLQNCKHSNFPSILLRCRYMTVVSKFSIFLLRYDKLTAEIETDAL